MKTEGFFAAAVESAVAGAAGHQPHCDDGGWSSDGDGVSGLLPPRLLLLPLLLPLLLLSTTTTTTTTNLSHVLLNVLLLLLLVLFEGSRVR